MPNANFLLLVPRRAPLMLSATLALALLATAPRTARACICPEWHDSTVDAGIDVAKAAAVFEGQVLAVEQEGQERRARVRVLRSWKGATAGEAKILMSAIDSCGASFELGEVFLFNTWTKDGRLWTGLCEQTRGRDASSKIVALGSPLPGSAAPLPAPPPSASGPGAVPRAASSSAPPSQSTGVDVAPRGCAGCMIGSAHDDASPWVAIGIAAACAARRRRYAGRWSV